MTTWVGSSGLIDVAEVDGAAIVTLARPDKLNALTIPMLRDIAGALDAVSSTKGVVLIGAGRAFSAGDDLPATEDLGPETFDELLENFQEITRRILRSPAPVVACLNGIAVGGAAEMTLACDARIGWARSDYLFPENSIGLTISNASSYLLPRLLGPRALPLVLDGRRISGSEAHALGLIDYFVDSAEEVLPKALALLDDWTSRGLATPFHLQLLRPRIDDIELAIERENSIGRQAWEAGTAREGIARFVREQAAKRSSDGS